MTNRTKFSRIGMSRKIAKTANREPKTGTQISQNRYLLIRAFVSVRKPKVTKYGNQLGATLFDLVHDLLSL